MELSSGISIPKESMGKFTPIVETPEEIAAKTAADKKLADDAAAATAAAAALGAGSDGGEAGKTTFDPSLLSAADPALVSRIEEVGVKEEGTLTEEEKKLIEDNLELVKAIANQEISPISQLMQDEGFLEEGDYGDDLDGFKGYLGARDEARDKTVVSSYLDGNPQVKALSEHLGNNKPLITFLAQIQKPAILSTELASITETMDENQKDVINSTYEEIIVANLKSNGMDKEIVQSVVAGAKANGSLYSMAKTSLKNMNATYDLNIEEENQRAATKRESDIKGQKDMDDKVTALVRTGKLTSNISVPKSDEANFIKALTIPINDKGDRMIDKLYSALSLEERAALDYIVYKGLKIPTTSKTNIMQKYKLGKEANKNRTPLRTSASGNKTIFNGLNLSKIAENQGFL